MLKLRHELEVENPKTKVKSKVTLEVYRFSVPLYTIHLLHFQVNFIMQHHKYSLAIKSYVAWERDIYVNLLIQHIKEEKRDENERGENNV